jgi:hypothetical protein
MNLLPWRRFAIVSALPVEETRLRLRESIGPVRRSIRERTEQPFTGRIDGSRFDVMRTTRGRNSVRPRVRGDIEAGPDGTHLRGTMKPHELVLGVLLVLALGPGWFLARVWYAGVSQGRIDAFSYIFPAIVVALLLIFGAGFADENRRALRMLAEIVEAERSEFV